MGLADLVDPQPKLQQQAFLGILKIPTENGADLIDAVDKGIAVDKQRLGGLADIAVAGKIAIQRLYHVGLVLTVILHQTTNGKSV